LIFEKQKLKAIFFDMRSEEFKMFTLIYECAESFCFSKILNAIFPLYLMVGGK